MTKSGERLIKSAKQAASMDHDYSEDVTKEGVDAVRKKVAPHLEGVDLVQDEERYVKKHPLSLHNNSLISEKPRFLYI